jgi:hypothetical protein
VTHSKEPAVCFKPQTQTVLNLTPATHEVSTHGRTQIRHSRHHKRVVLRPHTPCRAPHNVQSKHHSMSSARVVHPRQHHAPWLVRPARTTIPAAGPQWLTAVSKTQVCQTAVNLTAAKDPQGHEVAQRSTAGQQARKDTSRSTQQGLACTGLAARRRLHRLRMQR